MGLWEPRKRAPPPLPNLAYLVIGVVLVAGKGVILWTMGRPLLCPCGYVELWSGAAHGADNSQHLADWYSASHMVFGVLLYALMWRTSRHWPPGWLLIVAVCASLVWELAENTPWMIDRFGEVGGGELYVGDTILNSVADTAFVLLGYTLAKLLPPPAALAMVAVLEAATFLAIGDSLILGAAGFLLSLFGYGGQICCPMLAGTRPNLPLG